jgi:DNA-binding transcriptional LysR family regulator
MSALSLEGEVGPMNNIASIDALRCFLCAARVLNFRRAARAVATTPAAFTQRIQKLEEQLDCQLFVRSTRSVSLTEKGIALIPAAERCVAAAEECERIGRGQAGHQPPPMDLVLGTRQSLGMSWILPRREALMRDRPWLNMHLYFSSAPELHELVRSMQIDCAVTSLACADAKLESINLHREDYLFVASSELLAARPIRCPDDAGQLTLIDTTPLQPLFRYFRDAQEGAPSLRFAASSWVGDIAAVRHEILRGAGVGVLPAYFVRQDIAARTLTRIFPDAILQHDYLRLVFRASDPKRTILESLADALKSEPLE